MQSLDEIRSALSVVAESAAPRQRRYPDDLKAVVVDHVHQELGRGRALTTVAQELGITSATLKLWAGVGRAEREGCEPRLRPVTVRTPRTRKTSPARHLAVVTKAGNRVENLSVAEAAELLRALG